MEIVAQVGKDPICFSKPRSCRWAVRIEAILPRFTWALPSPGIQKQRKAQVTWTGHICPDVNVAVHMWQQQRWRFGRWELTVGPSIYRKGSRSERWQGSSGAGGDGEKENRNKNRVDKRNADSEKESEEEKGERKPTWIILIRGYEHHQKIIWAGDIITPCGPESFTFPFTETCIPWLQTDREQVKGRRCWRTGRRESGCRDALEKLGFDRVLCIIQHRNALDKVWSEPPKKVLLVCSRLDSQFSKLLSQGLGEGKLIPLVMKNACEEGEDIRALWRKKTTAPGFIIYIIINNDPIFPIPDFKIPNSL